MGPTVGQLAEPFQDCGHHTFNIFAHVGIGKPKSFIALISVNSISNQVLPGVVGITVNFDDQAFLGAKEVNDTVPYDVLPPKLVAKLASVEMFPKARLEGCRSVAEGSRSLE